MTEHDFETFLTLLKQTLRTSRRQREAIVGELRDHLLERLDALTDKGLSREEAMTRALDEFGDAAVLAAQFTSISRNRRRRLIMRTTLGTVVAAVAVVIAVVAFWPQSNRVPLSPRPLVAQDPLAADDKAAEQQTDAEPGEEALNDATMRKLKKRIDVDFIEVPLAETIGFLADVVGVQFYTDRKALEDNGVATDAPISLQLKTVPAEMVLDLILHQCELTYTLRNGIVIITTPGQAEAELTVRVYDVADLLKSAGGMSKDQRALQALAELGEKRYEFTGGFGGGPGNPPQRVPALEALVQLLARRQALVDAGNAEEAAKVEEEFYTLALDIFSRREGTEKLAELITTSVAPDTWDDWGGSGTITSFQGKLVVANTTAVHRKIDDLLRQLRAKDDAAAGDAVQP